MSVYFFSKYQLNGDKTLSKLVIKSKFFAVFHKTAQNLVSSLSSLPPAYDPPGSPCLSPCPLVSSVWSTLTSSRSQSWHPLLTKTGAQVLLLKEGLP